MKRSLPVGLIFITLLSLFPCEADGRRTQNPRLNLSIRDADVRLVITFLADEAALNVVMSESVTGRVTLFLRGLRVQNALNAVLRVNGLDYIRQGKVLLIMTRPEILNILDTRRAEPPALRIL